MRFAAPLLFLFPFLAACAVADAPPQIESDASACATLASCGCPPGKTYTCPSGQIVTCQASGTWPETACGAVDAGVDGLTVDATSDALEAASPDAANGMDAAGDSPAD